MQNIIIVLIVLAAVLYGIEESLKHFRGEGGCCGGSSCRQKKKKLQNRIIESYTFHIEGMHCQHCVNTVTEAINEIDGASARVSLRNHKAKVACDRYVDADIIEEAVRKHGYEAKLMN